MRFCFLRKSIARGRQTRSTKAKGVAGLFGATGADRDCDLLAAALLARRRPRSRRSRWRTSLPGWRGRSWPRVSATRNPPRWRHDARLGGRTARNAAPVDPAIRTTHSVPSHHRMRVFDRDLIRGGHYGQRSCEPRKQAEHMAATDQPHREENPCQQGAVHTWHISA
jgi:hypothetical protein